MSQCKSCGAPIQWVKTDRGKAMPLDPEPVPGGNVVVSKEPGEEPVAHVCEPNEHSAYVSHFATCPNAKKHRRK